MPLISVIVPIYKSEMSIQLCVDSILKQTFEDFELILVDDGSPDACPQICDNYAISDKRVKVKHKKNGGVSSARNMGIKEATGKYICFVDSDDVIAEDYLDVLLRAKQNYLDYDNIWCLSEVVDNYNLSTQSHQNEELLLLSTDEIMTLHEKCIDTAPYCKLYDKSVIDNNNITFDENYSLGEDIIFNFSYLDCTNRKILLINSVYYYHIMNTTSSLSTKYYQNILDIYLELEKKMLGYLKKWKCNNKQMQIYNNNCFYKYDATLKNTFHKDNPATKKEKHKYNKQILKSQDFKIALNNCDSYIHPLYRFAYSHSSYTLVRFLDKLSRMRNKF